MLPPRLITAQRAHFHFRGRGTSAGREGTLVSDGVARAASRCAAVVLLVLVLALATTWPAVGAAAAARAALRCAAVVLSVEAAAAACGAVTPACDDG